MQKILTLGEVSECEHHSGTGPTALSRGDDVVGVSAEELDVVTHPAQGRPDVKQSGVAGGLLLVGAQESCSIATILVFNV